MQPAIFLAALALLSPLTAATTPENFSATWKFKGIVLNEPGWDLWGASPVRDDAGNLHLFVERWPAHLDWEPGWRFHSEIAHYTGKSPQGPFRYVSTVMKPDPQRSGWAKLGIHNSNVRRLKDGRYALAFIARAEKLPTTTNNRIGLLLADSPDGPWKPANGTMETPVLAPPADPAIWCHKTHCGVCNPSLLEMPNGKFHLYFKASDGKNLSMGVAIADQVEGPYLIREKPITANDRVIEDGYAFLWDGNVFLLTTDNHGMIEKGGGLLWKSADGITFDPKPLAGFPNFEKAFLQGADRKKFRIHYSPEVKFERPQVLMENGAPKYLYVPSGVATDGSDGSNVHLLEHQ